MRKWVGHWISPKQLSILNFIQAIPHFGEPTEDSLEAHCIGCDELLRFHESRDPLLVGEDPWMSV